MHKFAKNILSWGIAICISFLFINGVTALLYHGAGWILLSGAPTDARYESGAIIVESNEGYAINKMDENGYSNPSTVLSEDGYVLAMGSSITLDIQNKMENHYTSVLNELLGGSDDNLKVYNVGESGATFDSMAKNFSAAVGEFPGAQAITVEFCILGIDENDLAIGFEQDEWVPGAFKNVSLSNLQKIKFGVKEYLPFVSFVLEKRMSGFDLSFDGAFGIGKNDVTDNNDAIEVEEYDAYYRDALMSMRNAYDGQIVLVYIPSVYLDRDGINVDEKPEIEYLLSLAGEYGIDVIDATADFFEAYEEDYTFPLGYWNTKYAPGHMNRHGNKIVANAIYDVLEVK